MGKYKRAEALLEILNANEIDTIFINSGLYALRNNWKLN